MSQAAINQTPATVPAGKGWNIVLWVIQIGLALMFLMAGFSKLSGAQPMIAL